MQQKTQEKPETYDNYYLSYSGTKLPLKLVNPLSLDEVENRNTYFGAQTDALGRTTLIHRVVYGEIDLEHRYGYYASGALSWAEILDSEGEIRRLSFTENGNPKD